MELTLCNQVSLKHFFLGKQRVILVYLEHERNDQN